MSAEQRITFATAFYPIRSKFPSEKYIQWATHLFSIVRQFYLVVFTDEATYKTLLDLASGNPHIRIVVRPWSAFHGMKYRAFWEKNHKDNDLLNRTTCWELNMLWNEKVWFVSDAIQTRHFPETEYYGWVDIGYFRNNPNNIHTSVLANWAHYNRLVSYPVEKVHYTMVNPIGFRLLQELRKQGGGIPLQQVSVAGGFFFGGRDPLLEWRDIFTTQLEQYVSSNRLLKDDQIIVVDCLLGEKSQNNPVVFHEGVGISCSCQQCQNGKMVYAIYQQNALFHFNNNSPFPLTCCHSAGIDDWFLFQRLL